MPTRQFAVPVEVPQANRTLTRLHKLINKALDKTYQFNITTAKKFFNRVLININLLDASAQDGGVIGSLVDAGDNCKQPRWRTSTNQCPCGLCSSEVSEQSVHCGTDRISLHRQYLQSLKLITCPLCSGHLDILTANTVEQPDVPSCSKSVPSRKRRNISQPLVDLDASESTGENERPVSMKKKVRITISTAKNCSEINSSFDKRDENDFI